MVLEMLRLDELEMRQLSGRTPGMKKQRKKTTLTVCRGQTKKCSGGNQNERACIPLECSGGVTP